jgi:hypothetical protein
MKGKRRFFISGLLAGLLVFSLVIVSCKNGSGGGNGGNDGSMDGTWTNGNKSLLIAGDSFTVTTTGSAFYLGVNGYKGSLSYNGSSITFTASEFSTSGGSSWSILTDELLAGDSRTVTGNYTLSSNTVTASGFTGKFTWANGTWNK